MRTSRPLLLLLLTVLVAGLATTRAGAAEPCTICLGEQPSPSTTTTEAPATTTTTAPPPPAGPAPAQAVARLLDLVNGERRAAGVGELRLRDDVGAVARDWSGQMAARGTLAHNDAYFTDAMRRRLAARALGENVAYNGDVDDAHRRLMASPGHRANILDGRYEVVGIGAVRDDAGLWWITQDFLQPAIAAPPPPPPPASPVAAAPRPSPVAAAAVPPTAPVTTVADPTEPRSTGTSVRIVPTVGSAPHRAAVPTPAAAAAAHPSGFAVFVAVVLLVVNGGGAVLRVTERVRRRPWRRRGAKEVTGWHWGPRPGRSWRTIGCRTTTTGSRRGRGSGSAPA